MSVSESELVLLVIVGLNIGESSYVPEHGQLTSKGRNWTIGHSTPYWAVLCFQGLNWVVEVVWSVSEAGDRGLLVLSCS